MALVLPLGLCLLAAVIACLPPADAQPLEGGSLLGMGVATALVLAVCAFAVVQLRQNDVNGRVFASSR